MAGEAAPKPAGHAVLVCSAHIQQAEAATGRMLIDVTALRLHAQLDHLLRRRWRTTSTWTLLGTWDTMQCDVYLVLTLSKPTKRADSAASTWQRMVRGLVANAGADAFALVSSEWAPVSPASKEPIGAAPCVSPYAQVAQGLLARLEGRDDHQQQDGAAAAAVHAQRPS